MPNVEVLYAQDDRFLINVRGHDLVVDQPVEEGGGDVGPTPTELFAASLAGCVGFYAERFLRRHNLPARGLRVECDYEMSRDRPARVGSIDVRIVLPEELPEDRRAAFQAVVEHCTVHNSLRRPPPVRIRMVDRSPVTARAA